VAPVAFNVVVAPLQIAVDIPASTTGAGFTVIVTNAVSLHPAAFVPTTVYVVVATGVATGLETVGLLSVPAGDQT
jgi:hypothetical protein